MRHGPRQGPGGSPQGRRRNGPLLALLLAALAPAACRTLGATTLERRDVQHLTVEPLDAAGEQFVRISGLAMHSALTVERIETQTDDAKVRVRVLMSLAKEGRSGSFSTIVHVPGSVRVVEFGDEHAVIWPAAGNR